MSKEALEMSWTHVCIFNEPAATATYNQAYTLSLHDALPIYQKKMVEQCLAELVFEIWTFRSLKLKKDLDSSITRNHENIAKEFFKLLLNNKIKERDVVFYANKLHVTPVYLSRAVNSVMGIPALQLIHNIILSESELLLRRKEMTIQQIAEELNFPDQATFSKFFKKHIGLSPIKYRKLNLV